MYDKVKWKEEFCANTPEVVKFLDGLETWQAGISKILVIPRNPQPHPGYAAHPTCLVVIYPVKES